MVGYKWMVTVAFDGGTSNGSSKLMVEVKGGGGGVAVAWWVTIVGV